MRDRYLEITFRKGKPLAAYLYLSRKTGAKSIRTEDKGAGLLVDYGSDEQPIGLEIIAPEQVTVAQINDVLQSLALSPIAAEELSPLKAA